MIGVHRIALPNFDECKAPSVVALVNESNAAYQKWHDESVALLAVQGQIEGHCSGRTELSEDRRLAAAKARLSTGKLPSPADVVYSSTIAQLGHNRRVIRDAIHLQEGIAQQAYTKAKTAVREALTQRHAELRRQREKALVAFASADAAERDFVDVMVQAGLPHHGLPVSTPHGGRLNDYESVACHHVREAVREGVLTGKEEWLSDVNHDGRLTPVEQPSVIGRAVRRAGRAVGKAVANAAASVGL